MKIAVDFISVYAALVPVMMVSVLCRSLLGVKFFLKRQIFIMYFLNLVPAISTLLFLDNFSGPIIIRICFAWPLTWVACLVIVPIKKEDLGDEITILWCLLASGLSNSVGGIILFLYAKQEAYKDPKVLTTAVIMVILAIGASIAYSYIVKEIKKTFA